LAFLNLGSTAALSHCLDDVMDMLSVFFVALEEDQNIVEVSHAGTVDVPLQDVVDKALKHGWYIA
jgi:hypothetical protein